MAESTLSLSYTEVAPEVAQHLGYPRDTAAWSSDQESIVHRVLDKGYRDFLNSNEWSFLRNFTTIATVASDNDYDLPDDFGSVDGRITFGSSNSYSPIIITGEPEIRAMQTGRSDTSIPTHGCIRPKTNDGTSGQRYELVLFPTPDQVYTLYYAYNVIASTRMRPATPYPLGGMLYGEAIQMCCIAAADRLFRDMSEGEYQQVVRLCVASAIERDHRMKPNNIGYNGDAASDSFFQRKTGYALYNGSVGS